MPTLKPTYEAFCRHYVVLGNATEAARTAGYSFESASQQGYRLLRRPTVAARVKELRDEIAERECLSLNAQLAKLEIAMHKALAKGQPAAVAKIVETEIRLPALFAKAGVPDGGAEIAALRAELSRMAAQLGLPAPQNPPKKHAA